MESERFENIYDLCQQNMNQYVLAHLNDGMKVDGIITAVDGENVILAVPNSISDGQLDRETGAGEEELRNRPYNPYYYGSGYYGGYRPRPGYYGGYGPAPGYYGYGGPGRFSRLILPLAAITALSTLPWF